MLNYFRSESAYASIPIFSFPPELLSDQLKSGQLPFAEIALGDSQYEYVLIAFIFSCVLIINTC